MVKRKLRQKGTILIIALLLIGLVEVVALGFVENHRIAMYFSRNYFSVNEGINLALGVEDWAKGQLLAIYTQKEFNDPFYYLPRTSVKGGYIEGVISDVQGKYNINNLRTNNYRIGFSTMLSFLSLSDNAALQKIMISSVLPLKSDADATQMLYCSVTELRALPGMTAKVFEVLLPHIFALPEITPININSADVVSLMILSSDLNEKVANEIIKARASNNGFKSQSDFLALPIVKELASPIESQMITVKSNYFLSSATVHYHDIDLTLNSLLRVFQDQDRYKILVEWRSFGTL